MTTIEKQIQTIYVAYYGRPADPAGLDYWQQQLTLSRGDLSTIIDAFGNSAEFVARYGNLNNTDLINNLYLQSFGRPGEADGAAADDVGLLVVHGSSNTQRP